MDEIVIAGKKSLVELTQEEIEVLLGVVDATDDLDDDEVYVINGIVRRLPTESIYDIRWFEDKLTTQRLLSRHG